MSFFKNGSVRLLSAAVALFAVGVVLVGCGDDEDCERKDDNGKCACAADVGGVVR